MGKKPTALNLAGLMVKGQAEPPKEAPQRSADVSVKSDPEKTVLLQFKVPASLRTEFEEYAFNSSPRKKMNALFKEAFIALKEKEGRS